jgi:glutamate carboxypeptidase
MTLKSLLMLGLVGFPLWAQADANLDFLKELVSISSDTKDVSGVNAVQDKVAERLKKASFSVSFIENAEDPKASGKMLVAEWAGQSKRFITLVTHADTVFEKLNPFQLSADGKKASGSGVIDNKGGIVVGILAAEAFLHAVPSSRFSLRIVVSPAEETGSHGFAEKLKEYSADSVFLIGLEPGLSNGSYVSSRKGVRWYSIHVTGKEAHAGVNHQAGVNACADLAEKLAKIQAFTDYKKGNTVSVGNMSGGKDKFNIVCGEASAKVDTRFSDPEVARILFRKIEQVLMTSFSKSATTKETTKTTFTYPVDTPPLKQSSAAHELLQKYVALIQKMEGRTITGEATGGVADLNKMARPGVLIADGMGPVGGGVHTGDEFLNVDSLSTRSEALGKFLGILEHDLK